MFRLRKWSLIWALVGLAVVPPLGAYAYAKWCESCRRWEIDEARSRILDDFPELHPIDVTILEYEPVDEKLVAGVRADREAVVVMEVPCLCDNDPPQFVMSLQRVSPSQGGPRWNLRYSEPRYGDPQVLPTIEELAAFEARRLDPLLELPEIALHPISP